MKREGERMTPREREKTHEKTRERNKGVCCRVVLVQRGDATRPHLPRNKHTFTTKNKQKRRTNTNKHTHTHTTHYTLHPYITTHYTPHTTHHTPYPQAHTRTHPTFPDPFAFTFTTTHYTLHTTHYTPSLVHSPSRPQKV